MPSNTKHDSACTMSFGRKSPVGECARCDELRNGSPARKWRPIGAEINWEDSNLYCADSGKRIESAYAEPEESAS